MKIWCCGYFAASFFTPSTGMCASLSPKWPISGKAVGDALDVAVDAEISLDQDEPAARFSRRFGAIGVELVAIRCSELDHFAHGYNPRMKKNAQALLELATIALKRAGANDRM